MKRPAASRPPTLTPRPPPAPRKKASPSTEYANAWLIHHLYVLTASLGQIARTPLPSLMTAAVIGIALALPTGLYLLLENAQRVSQEWSGTAQISLFLKPQVEDAEAHKLAEQLHQRADIGSVRVISRAEALEEYRALSGFSEALNALEENPLPAVLVVQPAPTYVTPQASQTLLDNLTKLEPVDVAQFDMRWLKRLFAMLQVVQRGVWVLASLLALTVLLVVGNTIRLAIYNRREEIEVNKLFGATDAFIRRPFLYTGFWYGLSGAIIAWGLVNLAFWLLQDPVKQLTTLYYSQFELVALTVGSGLVLLISGILLGLIGAWLAVGRHLKDIQPR